jgi:hypothetical protein
LRNGPHAEPGEPLYADADALDSLNAAEMEQPQRPRSLTERNIPHTAQQQQQQGEEEHIYVEPNSARQLLVSSVGAAGAYGEEHHYNQPNSHAASIARGSRHQTSGDYGFNGGNEEDV